MYDKQKKRNPRVQHIHLHLPLIKQIWKQKEYEKCKQPRYME